MPATSTKKQGGFTIPEILTVLVVLGVLITLVLTSLGDFYTANTTTAGRAQQDTDTRGVLHSIASTVSTSQTFLTSVTVAPPLGPDNNATSTTWSYKGNSTSSPDNRVLITSAVAAAQTGNLPLFQNTGTGCDADHGAIVNVRYMYFVAPDPSNASVKNLYRRSIVMPTAPLCSTPAQKTTCSKTVVAANPVICQGNDALLLSNVSNFTVDYYNSANDNTPIADQYSATTDMTGPISSAKTIKVTVTTNLRIDGKITSSTADIRISRS